MKLREALKTMFLKALFRPRRACRVTRTRSRLFLEPLEDRTTPTQLNWIGPDLGAWEDPANWLEGVVPGPGNIVNLGFQDNPNTGPVISTDVEVREIVCWSGYTGAIRIEDARLTVTENFWGGDSAQASLYINDHEDDGFWAGISVGNILDIGGTLVSSGVSDEDGAISAGILLLRSGAIWTVPPSAPGRVSFTGSFHQHGLLWMDSEATLSISGSWIMEPGSVTLVGGGGGDILYSGTTSAIIGGRLAAGAGARIVDVSGALNPFIDLVTGGVIEVWDTVYIDGTLEIEAGTVKYADPYSKLEVYGDCRVFLGTIEARVSYVSSSLLKVSGNVSLHQTLRVIADGPIEPGAIFSIIEAGGEVSGDFTTLELPEPPPDSSWTTGWVWNPILSKWEYRLQAV